MQSADESSNTQDTASTSKATESEDSACVENTPSFKSPAANNKKKKVLSMEQQNQHMLQSAFGVLKASAAKAITASRPATSVSDESQMFANYLAVKLKTYSQRTKNVLQHQIGNLFLYADNGEFEHNPPATCGYSTQPPTAFSPRMSESYSTQSPTSLPPRMSESPPSFAFADGCNYTTIYEWNSISSLC